MNSAVQIPYNFKLMAHEQQNYKPFFQKNTRRLFKGQTPLALDRNNKIKIPLF
jgi:hypothetical protein